MAFCKELGIENLLYWGCYAIGFLTIFVFNAFYGKKYGIKPMKSVVFTVISYSIIMLWAFVLGWVANRFTGSHHNAIRVYIWMPVLLIILCMLFKIEWMCACDFLTPSTCIVYGISRLGCVFAGCCYGVPASWGIYSVKAGHNCFPVQLLESITALAIAAVILLIARKKLYKVEGLLYPFMLILFGGTRFIWEFFSENPRVFGNVTELAMWALATCITGVVWYIIAKYKRMKEAA